MYVAKNLQDIADIFQTNRAAAEKRAKQAKTQKERIAFEAEARTWEAAADILNSTKLEP